MRAAANYLLHFSVLLISAVLWSLLLRSLLMPLSISTDGGGLVPGTSLP
jgi:hypothetical protein